MHEGTIMTAARRTYLIRRRSLSGGTGNCNVLHRLLHYREATHNTVAGVLFTTVFVIAIPLKQMMLQVNRSDKDNGEQNPCDGRRNGSISPKPTTYTNTEQRQQLCFATPSFYFDISFGNRYAATTSRHKCRRGKYRNERRGLGPTTSLPFAYQHSSVSIACRCTYKEQVVLQNSSSFEVHVL